MAPKNKKNNSPKNKVKARPSAKVARRPAPFLKSVSVPAAYGMAMGSRKTLPFGSMTPNGAIIKNFELVTAYGTPSADFYIAGYSVNPGVAATFPWLSKTALNYQKCKIHFMRFMYSANCSTAASGKSWLLPKYDTADTDPATFAEVMASDGSSSGPIWFGGAINEAKGFDPQLNGDANVYVDVDLSKLSNEWFYVRTAAGLSTGSLSGAPTGGIGTLVLNAATEPAALPLKILFGSQAAKAADGTTRIPGGELYVSYIVEFAEPVAAANI